MPTAVTRTESRSSDPPPPAYAPGGAHNTTHVHGAEASAVFVDAKTGKPVAPPPAYPTSLPPTYPIGRHKVAPLVSVAELESHLRVLGAFSNLRGLVEEAAGGEEKEKQAAWTVYLSRAVYRFHKWATTLPSGLAAIDNDNLPPIDVLMVWHSYLLVSSLGRYSRAYS